MTHLKANAKAFVIALIGMTFAFAAHAKVETSAADIDFDRYQTYSWSTSTEAASPAQQQIRNAVDAQLEEQGLQLVEEGGDLEASFETQVRNEVRIDSRPAMTLRPRVDRWMHFHGLEVVDIREVTEGQLDVRLTDADQGTEVWHGTATGTPRSKAEKNAAKIEKAAKKMFRNFPNGR